LLAARRGSRANWNESSIFRSFFGPTPIAEHLLLTTPAWWLRSRRHSVTSPEPATGERMAAAPRRSRLLFILRYTGHQHAHRAVSQPGDWQRRRGQAPRLDPGETGPEDRGRRTVDGRRLLPQRRLPAQQERHLQRQGRLARPPDHGPGGGHRLAARGHARR